MDGVSVSRSPSLRVVLLAMCLTLARAGLAPLISAQPTKASSARRSENPDPNIRYIAYAKLGSPSIYEDQAQKDEAVKIMIAKLDEGREPIAIRSAILRSLGNLGDRRAREAVLRGIADTDNAVIRVEACRLWARLDYPKMPRPSRGS